MEDPIQKLRSLFEEIGQYQQRITEGTILLDSGAPEIEKRVLAASVLLPAGNEHVWDDLFKWIMAHWAEAHQQSGDAASEPWRVFLVRVKEAAK